MNNKNRIIRFLFYLSVYSAFSSLFVSWEFNWIYFVYDDLGRQPNLISNPAGTSINHFAYFIYLSIIGLLGHLKND